MKMPAIPTIKWTLPLIIIVILAAGYLFKSCQKPPGEKLPPEQKKTIDSLNATKPDFDRSQDSIRHIVVYDTLRAERYKAAATHSEAVARRIGATADSLARAAETANDSAAAWHRAYDARTQQVGELQITVAKTDSAYQAEKQARINLSTLYGADTLRRIAVEKLNTGLQKTIDELERPCKFAKFIPCPSRTTTAVVSSLTTATLTVIATKKKN